MRVAICGFYPLVSCCTMWLRWLCFWTAKRTPRDTTQDTLKILCGKCICRHWDYVHSTDFNMYSVQHGYSPITRARRFRTKGWPRPKIPGPRPHMEYRVLADFVRFRNGRTRPRSNVGGIFPAGNLNEETWPTLQHVSDHSFFPAQNGGSYVLAVDAGRESILSVWQWQWGHLLGKVAVRRSHKVLNGQNMNGFLNFRLYKRVSLALPSILWTTTSSSLTDEDISHFGTVARMASLSAPT